MTESDLVAWGGAAYRLAARVLGSAGDPEDALQEAYLAAVRQLRKGTPPDDLRAWFLKVVVNTARNQVRSDINRRRREAAMPRETAHVADETGISQELIAALGRAMGSLEEKFRLPVALCCEEGMPQREAAAILEMPESTVNKYVSVGLEKLRKTLTQAGYAAAPTAILGGLAHTAAPVPATLTAALHKLVTSGSSGKAAVGAASSAAKGGLIVKIGLGLAAVGLVAGAAVWSAAGRSGEQAAQPATATAAPAGEKPSKFATPVWHPEARWERERWAGFARVPGNLDGPHEDVLLRNSFRAFGDVIAFDPKGGPYGLRGHDRHSGRIHYIVGSSRGSMDGPFSRARWGGYSYGHVPSVGMSPDRRFQVRTDPSNGYAVRILDFKEQTVRTALPPGSSAALSAQALVVNSKGEALVLANKKGRLVTIDMASAKITGEMTLKATEGLDLKMGRGLALDEKRNRLYASGTVVSKDGKKWHVWYFDLNDGGTFHGVLAGEVTGAGNPGHTGPFDGYKGYPQHSIGFGPDDPDFRFLYMRLTDTHTFQRLDLERRMVAACSGPTQSQPAMFIESGRPNITCNNQGPVWLPNGDFFMGGYNEYIPATYFRRVK